MGICSKVISLACLATIAVIGGGGSSGITTITMPSAFPVAALQLKLQLKMESNSVSRHQSLNGSSSSVSQHATAGSSNITPTVRQNETKSKAACDDDVSMDCVCSTVDTPLKSMVPQPKKPPSVPENQIHFPVTSEKRPKPKQPSKQPSKLQKPVGSRQPTKQPSTQLSAQPRFRINREQFNKHATKPAMLSGFLLGFDWGFEWMQKRAEQVQPKPLTARQVEIKRVLQMNAKGLPRPSGQPRNHYSGDAETFSEWMKQQQMWIAEDKSKRAEVEKTDELLRRINKEN